MNRQEIEKVIPHRDNMLLLEQAWQSDDGIAHGSYRVTGDEFFLKGHFPGNPIVPGVILCEIMAQTACVLFKDKAADFTPMFTGLNNVKFKNSVRPGDTIMTQCKIDKSKSVFYFASGSVEVNGKICVTAEFSFALIDNKRIQEAKSN